MNTSKINVSVVFITVRYFSRNSKRRHNGKALARKLFVLWQLILQASFYFITTMYESFTNWGTLFLDEMVISSSKYEIVNTMMSSFESRMTLTVRRLEKINFGGYRCVAKNSLGEVDSVIRLYGKYKTIWKQRFSSFFKVEETRQWNVKI